MKKSEIISPEMIWSESGNLSPRVRRLREEYYSLDDRPYFRNEVMPFTTGTEWDEVWSPVLWGIIPEIVPFMEAFGESLKVLGREVDLPEGFWEHSLIMRRALFFREVLRRYLPVRILEGELVVGGQFNTALSKCHNRKEARRWKGRVKKWWKGCKEINELGLGNTGAIPGHVIPDYPMVLRKGFKGIYKDLESRREKTDDAGYVEFLEALMVCCEAVRDLARRYAEEARRLADKEENEARAGELGEIAGLCEKVPWEPAENFYEAIQSLWFTHMLIMAAESYPGAGLSHGRFDQYMYPYYRKDLDSGVLTEEKAREIIECYWIKHNYAYDFQCRILSNQGINSGFGQLMTIGGLNAEGEDASNELTWLLLDIIEDMNMLEPKPNIRLHAGTPEPLMRRVTEMLSEAQGSPFLMNFDENSIQGLAWQGLPRDRLWDYAPVGCLENTLQGDDRSGTVDVNVNLAKAVEMTFFSGRDAQTGKHLGPNTGKVKDFRSWEEFREGFETQLEALMKRMLDLSDEADAIRAEYEPTPYLSTLIGGCVEKGKDITQGGARYGYITVEGVAFATAADSLAAVKKLVYEDGKVNMEQLDKAIHDNFENHEALRQTLVNKAPKYGNDDDYADEIARYLSQKWTRMVTERTSPATGRKYRGGYLSWNYWISFAPSTAATPDGRKNGTFLSNAIGPVNGADRHGPTAVTLSVGKMGLETAPNGSSHTISFSTSLLRDEEHITKLMAFLRGYGEKGGTALQVNVIDPDTLREAQERPEEYGNLLVRVTGYNAYFVMLGKEIQDEIIARESHAL
ncbi:MAG: pyruvate formate lyase family protein [Actinomycetota bacterium]|nr:pyruvate formate lyase family protein [Actinomycetota bacterium]